LPSATPRSGGNRPGAGPAQGGPAREGFPAGFIERHEVDRRRRPRSRMPTVGRQLLDAERRLTRAPGRERWLRRRGENFRGKGHTSHR
jgi:hypothetical protein